MRLLNLETIGERLYGTFDVFEGHRRYEILFVTEKEDSYFVKVKLSDIIRFYKISFRDYNMIKKKLMLLGIVSFETSKD